MCTSTERSEVVVTGLGAITPIGDDVCSTWAALVAGTSGVTMLDTAWAAGLSVRVAARVAGDPGRNLPPAQARTLDRSQQFALVAAREAWADAGSPDVDPERLAVVIASGVGGIQTLLAQNDVLRDRGARHVSPFSVPMLMPNGSAAVVGLELGARAGIHAPTAACASGAEAIALGLDLIRAGRADVVVCGGAEAAIHPLTIAGFAAMRALSTRGDPAAAVSRPFDRRRDGFVIGEGGAVLVLETAQHARSRSHRPYAQLAGAGITSDAHHVTRPDPECRGAVRAITLALRDANAPTREVVHVNAHATSTPLGDAAEALAIRTALCPSSSGVPVSGTKSTSGHLLGAAGPLGAIGSVKALAHRMAPVTINTDDLDESWGLDLVADTARPLGPGVALANSFGFGGHNVVLAFRSL